MKWIWYSCIYNLRIVEREAYGNELAVYYEFNFCVRNWSKIITTYWHSSVLYDCFIFFLFYSVFHPFKGLNCSDTEKYSRNDDTFCIGYAHYKQYIWIKSSNKHCSNQLRKISPKCWHQLQSLQLLTCTCDILIFKEKR